MATKKKLLQAAAGSAGGSPGPDVDEVFATRLWEGTGASRTISNDIDLSGEGGLVWIKKTSGADNHGLYDTERGATKNLRTNGDSAEGTEANGLTAFTSSGFTIGGDGLVNENSGAYVGWSFRKAENFFDIQTWTGDGTNPRNIAHNLKTTPGCIIVKCTSGATDWRVYHRGLSSPESNNLFLHNTNAASGTSHWANTAPTSTHFTVSNHANVNASGQTYVAYLFAHNDDDGGFGPDGDADIVKCGSFTSDGTDTVTLGFEPQWILLKRHDASSGWYMWDIQRGWETADVGDSNDAYIFSNTNAGESGFSGNVGYPTSTGFQTLSFGAGDYVYIAISRGPLNVPTDATNVFTPTTDTTGGTVNGFKPHEVDMAWFAKRGGDEDNFQVADRVRGFQRTNLNADDSYSSATMSTNKTSAETLTGNVFHQTITYNPNFPIVRAVSSGGNFIMYGWKRAPHYFDIVAWTGDGNSNRTVQHNLKTTPQMAWVRRRNSTGGDWVVVHEANASGKVTYLNAGSAEFNDSSRYEVDATNLTLPNNSNTNSNGDTYIAYLFATVEGVSKVGSYTGTGSDLVVDCGFTSGARFVLIKNITSAEHWFVFDTARGITTSTSDPYMFVSLSNAEGTSTSIDLDPASSGFKVAGNGAQINTSGDTYIFYAIA